MTIPLRPPADFGALIERDRRDLVDLCSELTGGEWLRPSPCPGWSVLDVAVHILGDDVGVLARDRDGYHHALVPDASTTPAQRAALVDDRNQRWVEANRRQSPRLVVELLRWAGAELVTTYRRQDPTAVTAVVSWASDALVPKWLDQARELSERWVHHQQIRIGTGRPSRLDPEVTGAVLDTLSWAYPHRLSRLARPAGSTVEIEITGHVERSWWFVAQPGRWVRTGAPAAAPAVRLVLDADVAWRLLTNGLDRRPPLEVEDDPELAAAVLGTRAIIAVPNF